MPRFVKPYLQPAGVLFARCFNTKSPPGRVLVAVNTYRFNGVYPVRLHKRHHGTHVIGRTVTQFDSDTVRAAWYRRGTAKLRWIQFVMRCKGCVKTAQAGKAAHHGDVRNGELCICQQLFGCQQSACL